MKCSFCGYRYREQDGIRSCAGCYFADHCNLVRCPHCGYEMPREHAPGRLWRRIAGVLKFIRPGKG